MDIGPIQPIRPVTMVRPLRSEPDLTGVFAAEFRDQQRDESYSPARKASRGLEHEDPEGDSESASAQLPETSSRSVNFFA
jgi:hypothetical protein